MTRPGVVLVLLSACVRRALLPGALLAACAGRAKPDGVGTTSAPVRERVTIVAAERGPQGARLVAIDERGDRQFDMLEVPGSLARDSHPTLSPDGEWVVFASSRERALDETSLWIAPVAPSATPIRLTDGPAIDSHPVWTPDGSAVVFASTREGGDFDIHRLRMTGGKPTGPPEPLTSGAGHEVTPAVASDGSIIYAAITPGEGRQIESHLEMRAADGTITRITEGPGDTSPALSPDERVLAFSRPVEHAQGPDAELWTMPHNGAPGSAELLIELPLTDESGPVWSADGRYVFATSLLRGAAGNAVFSSVIVIDRHARPRTARILQERTGAIARLTPAVARTPLDAAALAADPEYLPELARIMAAATARQREQSPP